MAIYKDSSKTKNGRQWYFRNYKKDSQGINKQYYSQKYFSKKEAIEAEALFLLKRDNPSNKNFEIISKAYFQEMYKIRRESTVYCYEKVYNKNIKPFFSKFNINEIQINNVLFWKEFNKNKKFSLNYLNKMHEILNSIFKFAIKNYGLIDNPVAKAGRFEKNSEEIIADDDKLRYITFEQFEQFIKSVNNNMWKTLFLFLYYTGLRKGEMQALNWNDIDFENKEIITNKTLSVKTKDKYKITATKNCKNRKVKMSKILLAQLLEFKQEQKKYADFNENWFVFGGPRFIASTTIDNNKEKYFKLAKINEITIHEFRHSHVSLLINEYLKSGQTDATKFFIMMANRMGHTVGVMQKTYMHLFPTIQDEIVNILDNL